MSSTPFDEARPADALVLSTRAFGWTMLGLLVDKGWKEAVIKPAVGSRLFESAREIQSPQCFQCQLSLLLLKQFFQIAVQFSLSLVICRLGSIQNTAARRPIRSS